MKILVTVSDQVWGGKHRYMYDVALGVQAAGHTVVVAAERGSEMERASRRAGLPTLVVPPYRESPEAVVDALRPHVQGSETPHIVCVTGRHDAAAVQVLFEQQSLPSLLVLFRHSAFPLERTASSRRLLSRADLIVATAWQQAEAQFQDLLATVDPRLEVVPSAVRPQLVERVDAADREALRRQLGLAHGQFAFAVLARLSWEKGIDRVIRALAAITSPLTSAPVLLVAGDGELRAELATVAAQEGITDRVRFLGHRDDIESVLAACDAVVLASTVPETGPLALKEAMAVGRLVVAPAIGGIPEFVVDAQNGLLFGTDDELRSAMQRLVDSPDLAETLGRSARESIAEGHRLDRRVEYLVSRLDLLAIRRADVDVMLAELAWDDVRLRGETTSGFVFVPHTSAIAELDTATFTDVAVAVGADEPARLTGTAAVTRRALVEQLYRMGALRRSRHTDRAPVSGELEPIA